MAALTQQAPPHEPSGGEASGPLITATHLLGAAMAVGIGALLVFSTRHGLGVSADGVGYLLRAEAFAGDGDLYDSTYQSSTHWPPGLPISVGALSTVTGYPIESIARVLNVATYVAVFLMAAKSMAGIHQPVRVLHLIAAAFFTLSYSVYWPATFVLTESAFLVLVMLALLALEKFDVTGRTTLLFAAAALASCATLFRYVGVVLLVPLLFSVLQSREAWAARVRLAAATAAIVIVPVLTWALMAPESNAPRHLSRRGMAGFEEFTLSLEQLGVAVVRESPNPLLTGVVVIVLPLGAVAALFFSHAGSGPSTPWARLLGLRLVPWLLFGIAYAGLIAAQRWWVGREILERYWPPYVIVAVVVVVRVLGHLLGQSSQRRLLTGLAVAGLVGLTAVNVVPVLVAATSAAEEGLGYNSVALQNSSLVQELRAAEASTIFTDSSAALQYVVPEARPQKVLADRFACELVDLEPARLAQEPVVVAIFGRCGTGAVAEELVSELPGAEASRDTDAGLLVVQWQP